MPLLAALLTLVMSGVAAADTYHGQHADYIFMDGSSSSTRATCVYTYPNANLKTLIVKAPKLWWPDSIAEKHHEHGTVGWRARSSGRP